MKVSTMRNRLHEAIRFASDEKIRSLFDTIPLEISRSELLTLEQVREVIGDAENFIRQCIEHMEKDENSGPCREQPEEEKKDDGSGEKIKRIKELLFVLFKDDGAPVTA